MTEHEFWMHYANRPKADRKAFESAIAAFNKGGTTMGEVNRRIANAIGLTINSELDTDDADSPAYTLETWAMEAIDGKEYQRKTGPDIRLAFSMANGMVLEARPIYQTNAAFLASHREASDLEPILLCDCNWQFAGGFALYLYERPQARIPSHRGFFGGYGYSLWTDGPQDVTDEAAATMWRIHRNHAEAFMGMPFCGVCRRPLTDDTSIALGIGPDCARLLSIPHGRPPARAAKIANEMARTGDQPERARNNDTERRRFAVEGNAHVF